jgi:uncharacterized membrane protein YfcA
MNGAAVIVFIVARRIWWAQTFVMLIGAVIGGYLGARVGRRLNPALMRVIITVISTGVTIAFFARNY